MRLEIQKIIESKLSLFKRNFNDIDKTHDGYLFCNNDYYAYMTIFDDVIVLNVNQKRAVINTPSDLFRELKVNYKDFYLYLTRSQNIKNILDAKV